MKQKPSGKAEEKKGYYIEEALPLTVENLRKICITNEKVQSSRKMQADEIKQNIFNEYKKQEKMSCWHGGCRNEAEYTNTTELCFSCKKHCGGDPFWHTLNPNRIYRMDIDKLIDLAIQEVIDELNRKNDGFRISGYLDINLTKEGISDIKKELAEHGLKGNLCKAQMPIFPKEKLGSNSEEAIRRDERMKILGEAESIQDLLLIVGKLGKVEGKLKLTNLIEILRNEREKKIRAEQSGKIEKQLRTARRCLYFKGTRCTNNICRNEFCPMHKKFVKGD